MVQGDYSLGNVRTDQVKRTARELVRRFPDKFSADFEENKHLVNQLVSGITTKIRNQIAGYITRHLAGEEAEEIPKEEEEGEAQ
jgi:small subunit ribosomal protein S17e